MLLLLLLLFLSSCKLLISKLFIEFEFEDSKNTGVINKIFDRKNYIIRKSVNLSKQTHIIAANIDVAFLLVTIDNPPTFAGFIDRFLATTEAYAIKAILLFNKVDVNDEATQKIVEELSTLYQSIIPMFKYFC